MPIPATSVLQQLREMSKLRRETLARKMEMMEKAGTIKWEEQNMSHARNAGLGTTSQGTTTGRLGASGATTMSAEHHQALQQSIMNQQIMMMQQTYIRAFKGQYGNSRRGLSNSCLSTQFQSPQPSSEDSSSIPEETNSSSPSMTKKIASPVYKQGTLIGKAKASTMDVEALPKSSKSTKLKAGSVLGATLAGSFWDQPIQLDVAPDPQPELWQQPLP